MSLDWADRKELEPLARLLALVRQVAGNTPLLLVGATARDLLLVHAHGIEPQRATEDTDLALAVPDWSTFQRLRQAMIESRQFEPGNTAHRLWSDGRCLDLIPFGGVERPDRTIVWPPDNSHVMSVLGFREALATALTVQLPDQVQVAVASLPAQALLKVWAWHERRDTGPAKDASDLWLLLRSYAEAGNEGRLYSEEGDTLAALGFDLEQAGACLLGRDGRDVLRQGPEPESALASLTAILRPEIEADGTLRLVAQMPAGNRDRQLALLTAFCAGLFDASQAD